MLSNVQMPSTKAVISAAASVAATAMLVRSVAKDFIPPEFQQYLHLKLHHFLATLSNQVTLIVDEFDGLNPNQIFHAAEVYLGTLVTPSTTKRFRVTKPEMEKKISLSMERNEEITDTFDGFPLKWRLICKQIQSKYLHELGDPYGRSTLRSEFRFFELSFHKKHKNKVVNEYLPHILEQSKLAKEEKKTLKLFTLKRDRMMVVGRRRQPWQSINLDHPATFDTLAMDWEAKRTIMEDLERFVKRKELYRRVGKSWKRGYLLFGPPGTGKSSMIAAMANYLNFDVYDLELTDLRSNSELRNLLISTANQSILVVEDIDCSIELQERVAAAAAAAGGMDPFGYGRGSRITLSGLLNFIDGLWSSCGDERIIVFTTNHKDRLDPALLRPGRMDVHIHMSYCTPCGFKMLAKNYLGITDHPLFVEVELLMETKRVTPAEVGEQLMKNDEPDRALKGLIEFLEAKEETEEVKSSEMGQKASGLDVKPEADQQKEDESKK